MSFSLKTKIIRKFIMSTKGFTLIELIITMCIIAIFTAIAMTKSDIGTNNFNSQIALDQITSDIDLAQSIAFAKNDTITIVFSVENDNYKLYTGPDDNRSIIDDFPGSNDGMVSFATGRLASIDISSINFNNSNELQFLPLGNVKSGGSIQINSATTITVSDITGKWSVN
mgnify:CR=1 FL=1